MSQAKCIHHYVVAALEHRMFVAIYSKVWHLIDLIFKLVSGDLFSQIIQACPCSIHLLHIMLDVSNRSVWISTLPKMPVTCSVHHYWRCINLQYIHRRHQVTFASKKLFCSPFASQLNFECVSKSLKKAKKKSFPLEHFGMINGDNFCLSSTAEMESSGRIVM